MNTKAYEEESKRFQSITLDHPDSEDHLDENFEENYEQDFEAAYENTDSLKASSISMTYSASKTGGFENFELPAPRYTAIEENPEENEDSKFQQPSQQELDLQNQRIQKAKQALSKIKKDDANKKKNNKKPFVYNENPKKINNKKTLDSNKIDKNPKKEIAPVKDKKKNDDSKKISDYKKKKNNVKVNTQENNDKDPKIASEEFYAGFEIETEVKATSQLPDFKPLLEPKPDTNSLVTPNQPRPIEKINGSKSILNDPKSIEKTQPDKVLVPKLKITPSVDDIKSKKKEEQSKFIEDHKNNLQTLKPIMDTKKEKVAKDLKTMEEIQKKLLDREKNYKIPIKEPPKVKKSLEPPSAPKPRALTTESYKMHQLAESTGNKDSRLTVDKLSGSMIQAIKVLSVKISEEFPYTEILEEQKRLIQAEKILSVGKDMKRGEVDYHEEAKKKINTYKDLISDNIELVGKKAEALKLQDDLNDRIKKLEPLKAVVKMGNGNYVRAGMMPDNLIDTLEELNSVGSEVMKENPVDVVIEKIEAQSYTLKQLFNDIDMDGDKILTITEIRNGLAGIQIKLSEDDRKLLLESLDANSDGVVSEEEFFKILDPKLRTQQEYRAIVGNTDVNNPIVFEERILDMKFKGKMLHKEIPKLVSQLKGKIDAEKKILARIKQLEKALEDRQVTNFTSPDTYKQLEQQLQETETKKNEFFKVSMQEKATNAMNVSALQEKIVKNNKEAASINAEAEYKKNILINSKIRQEKLQEKEKKLDEANKIIAIVIIQSYVKRFLARFRYIREKNKVKSALKIIIPFMKRNVAFQVRKRSRVKALQAAPKAVSAVVLAKAENVICKCSKCPGGADRFCVNCARHVCGQCFKACKLNYHKFGLIESESKELNPAEQEFIEIVMETQKESQIDFESIFRSGSGQMVYYRLKKALLEIKPALDKLLINNFLVYSTKYTVNEDTIDTGSLWDSIIHKF